MSEACYMGLETRSRVRKRTALYIPIQVGLLKLLELLWLKACRLRTKTWLELSEPWAWTEARLLSLELHLLVLLLL